MAPLIEVYWEVGRYNYQDNDRFSEFHDYVTIEIETDAGDTTRLRLDLGYKKWKLDWASNKSMEDKTPILNFFAIIGPNEKFLCNTFDRETKTSNYQEIDKIRDWIKEIEKLVKKEFEIQDKEKRLEKDF